MRLSQNRVEAKNDWIFLACVAGVIREGEHFFPPPSLRLPFPDLRQPRMQARIFASLFYKREKDR